MTYIILLNNQIPVMLEIYSLGHKLSFYLEFAVIFTYLTVYRNIKKLLAGF